MMCPFTTAEGYAFSVADAWDPHPSPLARARCGEARRVLIAADLVGRIAKGGEIVLAGFYTELLQFAFPPAFMKEARFRVAAEWDRDDLAATRALVESGALSLDGLITHEVPAMDAPTAYTTAFEDPACLKMILNWEQAA